MKLNVNANDPNDNPENRTQSGLNDANCIVHSFPNNSDENRGLGTNHDGTGSMSLSTTHDNLILDRPYYERLD